MLMKGIPDGSHRNAYLLRVYVYFRIEELDRIKEAADDTEQVSIGAPSSARALRRVRLRS
jgi:hypothetical protein